MITQVTYERVFNLGNYESERIGATATVEPADELDGVEVAYAEAKAVVEAARTTRQAQPAAGASYVEPPASPAQQNYIAKLVDQAGWTTDDLLRYASEKGIELAALTKAQASTIIEHLKQQATQESITSGWAKRMVTPVQPAPEGTDIPF